MKAIIIVGAARSGTKMLGNVFDLHKDTSYFGEVNHIWKTGSENIKHDAIPFDEKLINPIRKQFEEKTAKNTAIVEKTAANCLRLPLVTGVFDDVKIIHIVRDGRDVALSALQKWKGKNSKFEIEKLKYKDSKKSIIERIQYRFKNMKLKEMLHIFPKGIKMILTFIGLKKETYWGPIVPGLKEFRKSYTLLETCAYQWKTSEESVLNFLENHKEIPCYNVKYEDICVNTENELKKIFEFSELTITDNFVQMVDSIKVGNLEKWKNELTDQEIKKIQDIGAFLLKHHNYKII